MTIIYMPDDNKYVVKHEGGSLVLTLEELKLLGVKVEQALAPHKSA